LTNRTRNQPFNDKKTRSAFGEFAQNVEKRLLAVRQLIFDSAARTEGVGPLEETLKWGQPSYLTPKTKSGSTIRLGTHKDYPDHIAVFFHCQTNLVSTFRDLYPDSFTFEGNRALLVPVKSKLPKKELQHCLSLALTYHLRKKSARLD